MPTPEASDATTVDPTTLPDADPGSDPAAETTVDTGVDPVSDDDAHQRHERHEFGASSAPPRPGEDRDRPAGPAYADADEPGFTAAVDLAARRLGGMVLSATDEFFGPKEALLDPQPPSYDATAYYDRGKVMDGWETRRRREQGTDHAVVRLGVAGVLEALVVDTTHFRGNAPAAVSCEGCVTGGGPPGPDTTWWPLLPRTDVRPDHRQTIAIDAVSRVTHLRFSMIPDGGVARLRALGRPLVDLHEAADLHGRLDLAAAINGGRAVGCSDEFFSSPHNLIMVGDAIDMADGWETRRRRGAGEDWAILELAASGSIDRIELDTTHYKGNHPHRVVVEGTHAPNASLETLRGGTWTTIVAARPTEPHHRHVVEVTPTEPVTHLRLRVLPDGGVARLRAYGTIDEDGWRRHGLAMLDAADDDLARARLHATCGSRRWVERMLDARPFSTIDELHTVARRIWDALDPEDHLEAFAAHPRIGERSDSAASRREQAAVDDAERAVLEALEAGNRDYEERFGHVFLIRAAGRSADEMLAALQQRLDHDPATERRIAAEQQAEITALRLEHLIRHGVRHHQPD
ncbi:MAG: allantoicase [Nitriliruptoraceae bacterium]|nr:allantoicase [Nitriliruptoraceae bacterium]